MILRDGIMQAAQAALDALTEMARPVQDEEDLIAVAQTITAERDLSLLLGLRCSISWARMRMLTSKSMLPPTWSGSTRRVGVRKGKLVSPYLITDETARPGCSV